MGIIIKFILKSISEKKLRTFLILLAITLSSGVFFASMSISGSLSKMILEAVRSSLGNADILISQGPKTKVPYFTASGAEKYADRFEYIIGETGGSAIYSPKIHEEVSVSLKGIDIDDLQKMNPFNIEEESNLYPFDGRKIIINRSVSDRYNLKAGDSINLKLGSSKQKFTISAIASTGGPFMDDGQFISAVVPKDTLGSMNNIRGKVNMLFMKLKDPLLVQDTIKLLSEEYKSYRVEEPIPLDELKNEMSQISVVFMMLSSIVFFMSIFIIYSSFKVITAERLPVIGTFRSMGATRKMTNKILLCESTAYGIMGGLLGCVVGIGILFVISSFMTGMIRVGGGMKVGTSIEFTPAYFAISFVMAVVLCFISSIVPIIKVSRIPVKDIVLNFMEKPKKQRLWRLILGIAMMAAAFAFSLPESDELRPFFGSSGMLLCLIALVILVPYLTALFAKVFEKLYVFLFGNMGMLAAKNLRQNKSIFNNISMLAIGISSLLLFNTAGYDSVVSINDMYKDVRYDIEMYIGRADRNLVRQIQDIEGIKDVYGNYQANSIEVLGKKESIQTIKGVDSTRFSNFWGLNTKEDLQQVFNELDEGRNIMLTSYLRDKYGVQKGDFITLKMKSGEKNYKIIGFFENFMLRENYALVSERFLKSDTLSKTYNNLFITTYKNPDEVVETLKNELRRWDPYIITKEQRIAEYLNSTKQSTMLMTGFSVLAMVIGIFGILNNLLISFIERKHSFAVFRSMGMSKAQTIKMIFIEALTGGLIGGILGTISCVLMITILAGVSESSRIHYPFSYFIIYIAAGAAVMLLASISPALKTSKIDIVSAVKFE